MSHPPDLPDIVNRAFDVSRRAGYVSFCRNETGRLLAMLAADWSTLLDKGPFSLLFLDSGEPTEVTVDAIADLVLSLIHI